MKIFLRNIIWFLIPFLLGVIILFILPVDKKFSYQFVKGECNNIASWMYYRTFENSKSIDIAFSGASHFACGIMDEYIGEELNKHSSKKINVANLGYCRGGRDIQYVMLKDLFKHKNPKILFIEIAEDEPKKSHPVFPYFAGTSDLFGSCVFFNQRYLVSIWKGLTVRFEYLKFRMMGKSYFIPENLTDFGYLPSTQQASHEDLNSNITAWKNRLNKQKPKFLRNIEINYSKHYLRKITQLAKENNCKIDFIYLPESGSQLKTPLLSDYYLKFGEIITLPDSILNDNSNWKDAAHFNDRGAKLTSDFIVSKISIYW
jgi:hypothetical protein